MGRSALRGTTINPGQFHLAPSTAGVNCLLELKMCKACNVGLKNGYRRVAEKIFRLLLGIL
jgi:hypothetical protein